MKNKYLFSKILFSIFALFLSTVQVYADTTPSPSTGPSLPGPKTNYGELNTNTSTNTFIDKIFGNTSDFIVKLAAASAVLYIMYQSIQYITAGTPEKAKTAKQALVSSIIGVSLISAAYIFVRIAIIVAESVNLLGVK